MAQRLTKAEGELAAIALANKLRDQKIVDAQAAAEAAQKANQELAAKMAQGFLTMSGRLEQMAKAPRQFLVRAEVCPPLPALCEVKAYEVSSK